MRKKGSRPREGKPRTTGMVGELSEALALLEALVGPPLGRNRELGSLLRQIVTVLDELEGVPPEDVLHALRALARSSAKSGAVGGSGSPAHFHDIALNQVEQMLRDQSVSKQQLLRVANERFGVPLGVLGRLNREQIVKRIETLVRNERSQGTLARLASGENAGTVHGAGAPDPGDPTRTHPAPQNGGSAPPSGSDVPPKGADQLSPE